MRGHAWLGRVLKARLLILTKIGLAESPAVKAQAKGPQLQFKIVVPHSIFVTVLLHCFRLIKMAN